MMVNSDRRGQSDRPLQAPRALARLAALFVLGLVLFLPPLVSLPHDGTVLGAPALFAWLFLTWAGLIAALAAVVECGGADRNRKNPPPPPNPRPQGDRENVPSAPP
jgi:hypothetical protein